MAMANDRAPVIIGVGEASRRTVAGDYPSPVKLAAAAINAALTDCGCGGVVASKVDVLAAIRTFEDSGLAMGTGSPDNMPDAIATAAGLSPARLIYADIGGQSPQTLVNELAEAIYRGEINCAVIASGEAIGAAKRARKTGVDLDWRMPSSRDFENRLSDFPILDRREIRHGITSMTLAYSLIEQARRARVKWAEADYAAAMARLWAVFSEKSLTHEHAQFARRWTEAELMSDVDGNYPITDIYRRWMVAQDAVDLGAAIILISAGKAREWGVAENRMIWLTAAAEASESPLCQRANLSGSSALAYAVDAVLDQAWLEPYDIGPVDLYSCFPCAVSAGIDALGNPSRAPGDYTLTGGLSFFGGPGNAYSMHGIVAMAQALRLDPSRPGLITANGGVMSKQAAGVYSGVAPGTPWNGEVARGYVAASVPLDDAPQGKGRILTYARAVRDGMAGPASLLVEMMGGQRALAVQDEPTTGDLSGLIVDLTAGEKRHIAVTKGHL